MGQRPDRTGVAGGGWGNDFVVKSAARREWSWAGLAPWPPRSSPPLSGDRLSDAREARRSPSPEDCTAVDSARSSAPVSRSLHPSCASTSRAAYPSPGRHPPHPRGGWPLARRGGARRPPRAAAVITAADWETGPEQIARWVQVRMDQQVVLYREEPPRFSAIVDEFVLRRQIGGPGVLAHQLTPPAGLHRSAPSRPAGAPGERRRTRQPERRFPALHDRGARYGGRLRRDGRRRGVRRATRLRAVHPGIRSTPQERARTGRVAVRHSHHPGGTAFVVDRSAWAAFVGAVRNDEFDVDATAG